MAMNAVRNVLALILRMGLWFGVCAGFYLIGLWFLHRIGLLTGFLDWNLSLWGISESSLADWSYVAFCWIFWWLFLRVRLYRRYIATLFHQTNNGGIDTLD